MKTYHPTEIPNAAIRFAVEEDTALILKLIGELAEYEQLTDQMTATEEILKDSLFRRKMAEVALVETEAGPVGYALFFHNFSTFLGIPGIYLEDLFIEPQARGLGLGKAMLCFLAKLAEERGCGRLEWQCLDWNTPSIEFYKGLGAKPMDEWTGYRAQGESLAHLARQF